MKRVVYKIFSIIIAIFLFSSCLACNSDVPNNAFSVSNDYFSEATFEDNTLVCFDNERGIDTYKYCINLHSYCTTSLTEYKANITLYNDSNDVLTSKIVAKTGEIKAYEYFTYQLELSKEIQQATSNIKVVFSGKSYNKPKTKIKKHNVTFVFNNGEDEAVVSVEKGKRVSEPKEPLKENCFFAGWYTDSIYTTKYDFKRQVLSDLTLYAKFNDVEKVDVTFVFNNGERYFIQTVEKGSSVSMPKDPKKKNYLFIGWYSDPLLCDRYDFSQQVTTDIILYASYKIDALSITNKVSTDIIKGVVKVYNTSYNSILGITTSGVVSQGSGFCFHIQNGYYYILTNCHVARKEDGYDKQEFTIEDYLGNTYEASLYKNPSKSNSAISANYDLACLYFKPSSTAIKKLTMSSYNPFRGDDIISLGAPRGQSNYITFGKINYYTQITIDCKPAESNVQFNVVSHNAHLSNGSSGGPIIDSNLNVVGVNYGGKKDDSCGYAIPIEKVREFLNKYVYS